jgi:hypothetical protein
MAITAQGAVLEIESSTPGTYAAIGEVTGFSGPAESFTVLNVTAMSDTRMRKAMGLKDPGEVSVDLQLNYGDTGQDRCRTQFAAKARALFRIVVPAGQLGSGASSPQTTLAFAGFISSLSIAGRLDGIATAQMTITLDSDITET